MILGAGGLFSGELFHSARWVGSDSEGLRSAHWVARMGRLTAPLRPERSKYPK